MILKLLNDIAIENIFISTTLKTFLEYLSNIHATKYRQRHGINKTPSSFLLTMWIICTDQYNTINDKMLASQHFLKNFENILYAHQKFSILPSNFNEHIYVITFVYCSIWEWCCTYFLSTADSGIQSTKLDLKPFFYTVYSHQKADHGANGETTKILCSTIIKTQISL